MIQFIHLAAMWLLIGSAAASVHADTGKNFGVGATLWSSSMADERASLRIGNNFPSSPAHSVSQESARKLAKFDRMPTVLVPLQEEIFKDCRDCPEMIILPAGSFMMGTPAGEVEDAKAALERPVHRVTLAYRFAVGRYEVTFAEWDACVADGGCGGYFPPDQGWGRDRQPVIAVTWEDAQAYVSWLSRKTGYRYRLLTEAEWEYAARAGTTTPFSTGKNISLDEANFSTSPNKNAYKDLFGSFDEDGFEVAAPHDRLGKLLSNGRRPVPVGILKPNRFGLFDMHGNVWEWIEDCAYDSYHGAPTDGRARVSTACQSHVLRGGSWMQNVAEARSASRNLGRQSHLKSDATGFRVAKTLPR